jgi:hypothetical protein
VIDNFNQKLLGNTRWGTEARGLSGSQTTRHPNASEREKYKHWELTSKNKQPRERMNNKGLLNYK